MFRYEIKSGDTLYEIANLFNTTVERIIDINNITNPNFINIGDVLLIPGEPEEPEPVPVPGRTYNTNFINGLLYVIFTDERTYAAGRNNVIIKLIKCNVSSSNIELRYNTGQRYDFAALRDGREIWRWSEGRFFTQEVGREILQPGECINYSATWDLRSNAGDFVFSGNVEIRGYNVAQNYSSKYVSTSISVERQLPPAEEECPEGNLLQDSGIERWYSERNPVVWQEDNVLRSSIENSGNYAVEMGGINSNQRAIMSQTVDAASEYSYRIRFWSREISRRGETSNFRLEIAIYFYDEEGNLVGRFDPLLSPQNINQNTYQRYTVKTELSPQNTARAELRFVFRPGSNNTNTVLIDDVSLECIR
ncbi:MAG: LysM peptidoglycan-binding domain-containing protein [Clostridiales bacterium]|nr:LysM peptidoglycan-binding domain-containing protein [Clostridiales bacterium]MCF8021341.1 LysM peptidoglycan-binding domain-containing protein [Clostridiales bacterium]